jgi:hypothetical protein
MKNIILDIILIEQQHLSRVYNESVYVQAVLCKREYESTKLDFNTYCIQGNIFGK